MAKFISQETYNQVVKENIEEFSMTQEEAIEDAVKQFEAQGVDLSNIIKDMSIDPKDVTKIKESLDIIKNIVNTKKLDQTKLIQELNKIKVECEKGLSVRVAVGQQGAYDPILKCITTFNDNQEVVKESLKTMISLMTTQPDLLNQNGIDEIMILLSKYTEGDIVNLTLKWVKECCVKHEQNRQQIFERDILQYLKPLINTTDGKILKNVCMVLRSLVLDDDVRVEFGKAHEHARVIASDFLCSFIELLGTHKDDPSVVADILQTLISVVVRNEFCKKVDDAGGLDFVLKSLVTFSDNEKIIRTSLKLLKVLAGNDEVKLHMVQKGVIDIIRPIIEKYKESEQIMVFALNVIAVLALRSPDNCKLLFEANYAELIIDIMQVHSDKMKVQKTASWAIRNMVSRSKHQNEKFLSLGAEKLLVSAMMKFKKDCEYDIKAALRDLGCNVNLKEEWTGKGGKITTQANNPMRE